MEVPNLILNNGAPMPMIGLGTWALSDESELESAINAALEVGYRHIDTAFLYYNENIIGRILKNWFESGKLTREEVFVTTKLPVFALRPDKIEKFLKVSLENLQLDYVDMYLIHFPVCVKLEDDQELGFKWPEYKTEITNHVECWKEMEKQVDSGRAKAIGLSNFNKKQVQKILNSKPRIKPANLQIELHVYLQQHDLVNFCQKNGIVVTAYSSLGNPGMNNFTVNVCGQKPVSLPNLLSDKTVEKIAQKHGKTNAQVLLRYIVDRNIIVIPKSANPLRIKENFEIFDFSLDENDMEKLNSLEVGEAARILLWSMPFPGIQNNPEWPLERQTLMN